MGKKSKTSGTTMVELIIVLIVIAILAGVVFPRFAEVRSESYSKQVKNITNSLRMAADEVQSKSLASGTNVVYYNKAFFFTDNVNHFPETTGPDSNPMNAVGSVDNNLSSVAECSALWNNLLKRPPNIGTSGCSDCEFLVELITNPSIYCQYTYLPGGTNLHITYALPTGAVQNNVP